MIFGGRAYGLADIQKIGTLGLSIAEINLLAGGDLIYNPRELLREARKWNLMYLIHAPNEGDPWEIQRLEGPFFREIVGLIHACDEIAAPLLTVHFWMDGRFIPKHIIEKKGEILCRMAREGARKGVQVCVENLSEGPEDLEALLSTCPELGITLDIGHGQILARQNRALEFIECCPERIRHVHVHDNRGGDRVEDDLHLPIGAGIIDFPHIFRHLMDAGYQGTVTLEVPTDHLETSVHRLRRVVDSVVKESNM